MVPPSGATLREMGGGRLIGVRKELVYRAGGRGMRLSTNAKLFKYKHTLGNMESLKDNREL